jgi:hypothetical protein
LRRTVEYFQKLNGRSFVDGAGRPIGNRPQDGILPHTG